MRTIHRSENGNHRRAESKIERCANSLSRGNDWRRLRQSPGSEKFENKNYAQRLGRNEIVVNRIGGIGIFDSAVFGNGATDEIHSYPQETLDAPLSERNGGNFNLRSVWFFYYVGKAFGGSRLAENRIFMALPVASALVIACVGAVICYNSVA